MTARRVVQPTPGGIEPRPVAQMSYMLSTGPPLLPVTWICDAYKDDVNTAQPYGCHPKSTKVERFPRKEYICVC